ncbi:MAG: hypothetical protein DRJ38_09710 [Thermoprotei archaeon]|nr:MAG: hypothetical protein DRJ38_09710 [Thermoprotei archaeon]
MKDVLIVEDPETAKVLIDKTRLKILHLLKMGEHTVSELSQFLGLSPQAVFYHLKILEKHGLVEVARTVCKKNLVEKYYRATARIFLVSYLVFESEEFKKEVRDIVTETIEVFGLKMNEKEFMDLMRMYLSLKSRALEDILSKRRKSLHRKMTPIIDFLAVMRMASYPEFSKLVSRYRELEGL